MNLKLSPKHGLNPCIPRCYYCGKDKNEVLLLGKLKGDVEAPRGAVFNLEPCDECKGFMAQGIILISVDDRDVEIEPGPEGLVNPRRTGGWVVLKEEAVERIVQPPGLFSQIKKSRFSFVPDEAWDVLGLPRGEKS